MLENYHGVVVRTDNNTIGGTGAADRNVITGNTSAGILIAGGSGNKVQGNFIGTDVTGTRNPLGSPSQNLSSGGISITLNASNNTIGGTTPDARNVISANNALALNGAVEIDKGCVGNVVEGNYIGTDVTGRLPLGNASPGINDAGTGTIIGGRDPTTGNIIAFNEIGVGEFSATAGTGTEVLSNSIFGNTHGGLSIVGPAIPQLVSSSAAAGLTVTGKVNEQPGQSLLIQFFSNTATSKDPAGNYEGQTFVGETTVPVSATGGTVDFSANVPASGLRVITATATDLAAKATSNFSNPLQVLTSSDAALTSFVVDVGALEGQDFTGTVASFTDADPKGKATDFTATIHWSNGTTSTASGASGTIVGVRGVFNVIGSYHFPEGEMGKISTDIQDVGGASTHVDSPTNVQDAPILGTPKPFHATDGVGFRNQVIATFHDLDPNNPAPDGYDFVIRWGDGTESGKSRGVTKPGARLVDLGLGVFDVVGDHTYAKTGTFAVQVEVKDGFTLVPNYVVIKSRADVTGLVSAPVLTLGTAAPVSVGATFHDDGSFTSEALGPFAASVDYHDGAGFQRLALSPSRTFTLDHAFTRPGPYVVTVSVVDENGTVGVARLTVTVTATDPVVAPSGFGPGRDAFVTTLFLENLGRLPTPDDLKYWSGRLAAKVKPRDVARAIWTSPEHRNLLNQRLIAPITFGDTYRDAVRLGLLAAKK